MSTVKYVKIVLSSYSLSFHAYSSFCKAPKISIVCLWVKGAGLYESNY